MNDAEKIKAIRKYFRDFRNEVKTAKKEIKNKNRDDLSMMDYMYLDRIEYIMEIYKEIENDIKNILSGKEVTPANL